jgi:uncharacterized membrane protein YfcA
LVTDLGRAELVRTLTIGAVSGLLAGLLGIGGGGVMVPMLVAMGVVAQRQAHAVSLGAVIPVALAAALTYGEADEVRLGTAALLFLGGVVGAPLGALMLARANDRMAQRAFGLLLVTTSGYLLVA